MRGNGEKVTVYPVTSTPDAGVKVQMSGCICPIMRPIEITEDRSPTSTRRLLDTLATLLPYASEDHRGSYSVAPEPWLPGADIGAALKTVVEDR